MLRQRHYFSLSISAEAHAVSAGMNTKTHVPLTIHSVRVDLATWLVCPLSGYIQTNYTINPPNHLHRRLI